MTQPPIAVQSSPPKSSWFGRNWGKLLGCGCFGFLLLVAGSGALIYYFVISGMKSSDVYKVAVEKIAKSPKVQASLGEPVTPGFLVHGSISVTTSSGMAELSFPVSGPNGSGTAYVVAHKLSGEWSLDTLTVDKGNDGEHIDVLAP